jgi:16S rRNA (cytosine1402-N4)-methyltransferase
VKKIRNGRIQYDYHLPVLLNESVELLITNPDGNYIDGTLGGGGHCAEILKRLGSKGKLFSFDKDNEAIDYCKKRFEEELKRDKPKLILKNRCFSTACSIKELRGKTQGILLDLGLSSRQLDTSRRGFSYRANSRLNMQFGSHGRSAEELLNAADEEELERIFRCYGEEPFARTLARRLVENRRAASISTTFGLRDIVRESVPAGMLTKSLSRVFQAVRIAVNDELEVLRAMLTSAPDLLVVGGRIVVISYHSLEDRIVKNYFRDNSAAKSHISQYQSTKPTEINSNTMPIFRILTKKPIIPSKAEQQQNPRSRSAKMRAAEKI